MKIKYHKKFEKSYNKKSLKLREIFKKKLRIFIQNPFSFELKNHKLKWNFLWYNSINISWDYRAIFKELSDWKYEFVEFTDFWTHSEIYK